MFSQKMVLVMALDSVIKSDDYGGYKSKNLVDCGFKKLPDPVRQDSYGLTAKGESYRPGIIIQG